MLKASKNRWFRIAVAVSALLPIVVAAQIISPGGPPAGSGWDFNRIVGVLNTLITWVYTVFLILAVIFAILTAFKYLTSGGDPEKVKAASQMLIYVAVAIAVALLSVAIQFVIRGLLQV